MNLMIQIETIFMANMWSLGTDHPPKNLNLLAACRSHLSVGALGCSLPPRRWNKTDKPPLRCFGCLNSSNLRMFYFFIGSVWESFCLATWNQPFWNTKNGGRTRQIHRLYSFHSGRGTFLMLLAIAVGLPTPTGSWVGPTKWYKSYFKQIGKFLAGDFPVLVEFHSEWVEVTKM